MNLITDTVFAHQVENNDIVVMAGEPVGYVYMIDEYPDDDHIYLDVVDDEAEHTQYAFGPFDTVTLAVALVVP